MGDEGGVIPCLVKRVRSCSSASSAARLGSFSPSRSSIAGIN